ncbi:hypothetical protein U737_20055 [Methylomonas sp. LW13]|uniref:hypothetical protein n=1 Tax=unclassified Methylomonas TaxID=2608980 RepID=UPI00051BCA0E|nr:MULTISPECIES: hypothetical protein [unclassified Methylomonas]PKD40518.1 hypothetical protein CWO84_09560 [Methylomonas sp. Kb3]QBC29013.1 hypothetical protein U737_20055 [Methylomonas sp. LW13]
MKFPFAPDSWSDPIWQGMIASSVVLIIQVIGATILTWVRKSRIKAGRNDFGSLLYIAVTAVPFIVLLIISAYSTNITGIHVLFIAVSSLIPFFMLSSYIFRVEKNLRGSAELLARLHAAGVHDAVIDPTIEDYSNLLKGTIHGFSLLGVGAEKLTRDFEVFKSAMNRCSNNNNPARFLLVAPDVDWVHEGATRRGLGKSHFKELLIRSLRKIKQLKEEYQTPIEVRFYRSKPLFRILLINNNECWFGYYSESVVNTQENEFENKSHTTLIVRKPLDIPPDREFYGATEEYFNQLWKQAKRDVWDFEKYLS